jgi:hypothetical protein
LGLDTGIDDFDLEESAQMTTMDSILNEITSPAKRMAIQSTCNVVKENLKNAEVRSLNVSNTRTRILGKRAQLLRDLSIHKAYCDAAKRNGADVTPTSLATPVSLVVPKTEVDMALTATAYQTTAYYSMLYDLANSMETSSYHENLISATKCTVISEDLFGTMLTPCSNALAAASDGHKSCPMSLACKKAIKSYKKTCRWKALQKEKKRFLMRAFHSCDAPATSKGADSTLPPTALPSATPTFSPSKRCPKIT